MGGGLSMCSSRTRGRDPGGIPPSLLSSAMPSSNSSSSVPAASQTHHSASLIASRPLPVDVNATSPRKNEADESFTVGIPDTPHQDDKSMAFYKYYCPICMNYFKSILKSSCCGNYICLTCCKSYLYSKHLEASSIHDIIGNKYLKSVDCPNCGISDRLDLILVSHSEEVRSYRSSVESTLAAANSNSNNNLHSPLKVGDSFEDLKRKTRKFTYRSSNEDSTIAEEDHDNSNNKEKTFRNDIIADNDSCSNMDGDSVVVQEMMLPQRRLFDDQDDEESELLKSFDTLIGSDAGSPNGAKSPVIKSVAEKYIISLVDNIVSTQRRAP